MKESSEESNIVKSNNVKKVVVMWNVYSMWRRRKMKWRRKKEVMSNNVVLKEAVMWNGSNESNEYILLVNINERNEEKRSSNEW